MVCFHGQIYPKGLSSLILILESRPVNKSSTKDLRSQYLVLFAPSLSPLLYDNSNDDIRYSRTPRDSYCLTKGLNRLITYLPSLKYVIKDRRIQLPKGVTTPATSWRSVTNTTQLLKCLWTLSGTLSYCFSVFLPCVLRTLQKSPVPWQGGSFSTLVSI